MREVVSTDRAPPGIGPFSRAIRANGFVFVSGQIALDPRTGDLVAGDVLEQAGASSRTCRRF